MQEIQLEFNIDNKSKEELKFHNMQQQIDAACDSMGKVRRKLFAEITALKKDYTALKSENDVLKDFLRDLKNEKVEWSYTENESLFEIKEHKKAIG